MLLKDTWQKEILHQRDLESRYYSKQQTSNSSWWFLKEGNEEIKTVQNNSRDETDWKLLFFGRYI